MAGPHDDLTILPPDALAQITGFAAAWKAGSTQLFTNVAYELWLEPNQFLHKQDDPLTHVWLLVEGRIAELRRDQDENGRARQYLMRDVVPVPPLDPNAPKVTNVTNAPSAWLSVYDYLFEFKTYRTQARAVERCRLVAIAINDLARMIFQAPELRDALAKIPIIGRLSTIPTLRTVDLIGLGFLAEVTEWLELVPDTTLYSAGDSYDAIVFVNQGQVVLEGGVDPQRHWVGNGGAVGVAAAVTARGPIGAREMDETAVTTMPSKLLKIPHVAFHQITGFVPDPVVRGEQQAREETVINLSILADFSDEQRLHLTGYFSFNRYPVNHLLVQQNEQADSLWVLMPGSQAEVRGLDDAGRKLMPAVANGPTYFAETALLGEFPQLSTVEAVAGSEWMRLHWYDFEEFDIVEPEDLRSRLRIADPQEGILYGKAARKRYKWLLPGETVVYFSRRHWIAFLRKNIVTIVLLLFQLVLLIFGVAFPGVDPLLLSFAGVLAFLTLLAFIWGFLDYRNDWLVVTNRRVYYQEKMLFVNQWRKKEAPLEQIQNVEFQQKLMGRLLNFGTLLIQTAGSFGDIGFTYTTNFDTLGKVIDRQRAQRRGHTAAQSKSVINQQLEVRLGLLAEPPKRVYTGALQSNAITGWQARFTQRSPGAGTTKESDGRVVWHQHWMALLGRIGWLFWTPFFIAVILLLIWLTAQEGTPAEVIVTSNILEWIVVLILVVFGFRLLWAVVDWRNDTYEVTNEAVINVKKLPLGLKQERKAASLGRIQNVEMRIPSPIHLLLDYGTVIIQTAAEGGALIFSSVPNPRYVAGEISRRMELFQRREEDEQIRRRAEDLPDWFEMYDRMEGKNGGPNRQPAPRQKSGSTTRN